MMRWTYPLALLLTINAATAAPITLTHSMRLLDSTGDPLNGVHNVSLLLFDHSTSTASNDALWSSPTSSSTFTNGYAAISLTVDDQLLIAPRWLGVSIDGAVLTTTSPVAGNPTPRVDESIVALGGSRTWTDGRVAESCLQYRYPAAAYAYTGATGDGVYRIDPTGGNPADAVDVYCDMTTDGGGWSLIGKSGRGGTAGMTSQQYIDLIANPVDNVNLALLATTTAPTAGQQAWLNRPLTDAIWDGSPHQVVRVDVSGSTRGNDGRYYQRREGALNGGGLWTAIRDSRLWGDSVSSSSINTGGRDFFIAQGAVYDPIANTFPDQSDGHVGWWDVGTLTLKDGSTLVVSRHMGLLVDAIGSRGEQWLLTSNPNDSRYRTETTAFNAIIWVK